MSRLLIEDKDISKYWNYEKNSAIDINKVSLFSNKKAWWICPKGHEWETMICNMAKSKSCPYCTNRKILKGYNDLGTLFPNLADFLYSTLNDFILLLSSIYSSAILTYHALFICLLISK